MPAGTGAGALLNIKELANELGVHRRTVLRHLAAGTCPVAPVPGSKPAKFRKVDVEALIGRPIRTRQGELSL